MGHYVSWKKLNQKNYKFAAIEFWKKFYNSNEYLHWKKQAKKTNNIVLIGVGHDQAPFYTYLIPFFNTVNELQNDVEFTIVNQETFFKKTKNVNLDLYTGNLDYAINSKIHRTIASSKMLLKLLFAKVEALLYYQLEPLQLVMKKAWKNYNFFKTINWQKQIIKISAHDTLGGCVTDNVNKHNIVILNNVLDAIKTEINWIFYALTSKINQPKNFLKTNNYCFCFNPLLTTQKIFSINKTTINTNQKLSGYIINNEYEFFVLNSTKNKSITLNVFTSEILIINKKWSPLSINKIDFNQLIKASWKPIKITTKAIKFDLLVEDDFGDTYDFDPNHQETKSVAKLIKQKSYQMLDLIKLYLVYKYKKQKFYLQILLYKNHHKIFLTTINLLSKKKS